MTIEGFRKTDDENAEITKIGIGVLGCGFIGRVHCNAYLKIPYSFQAPAAYPDLIAICDRQDAADKALRFRALGSYTDWRQMIEDPRIDVVDNCTPDNLHHQPVIAAAANGKHVVCEKPLAMDVQQAREMMTAAQAAGVKHMCCHNYRFIPAIRLAWDLIQQGVIGRIYHFRARYLQEVGHDPQTLIEDAWYAAGTRSGVLLGIGSHAVDMARFLVGEITSVSGLVKTFNTTRRDKSGEEQQVSADEGNVACVEFQGGAIGTLESSGVSAGRKNQFAWEINGSRGSMAFDLEDPNHLRVYNADTPINRIAGFANVSVTTPEHPLQVVYLPPGHNAGWEYGHVHALHHFIDCVVNHKPVEPYAASFEDGYKVQVIMEAINRSSRTGQKIELEY